jgi:hypothetical protein
MKGCDVEMGIFVLTLLKAIGLAAGLVLAVIELTKL